jgi:hypothetical protein
MASSSVARCSAAGSGPVSSRTPALTHVALSLRRAPWPGPPSRWIFPVAARDRLMSADSSRRRARCRTRRGWACPYGWCRSGRSGRGRPRDGGCRDLRVLAAAACPCERAPRPTSTRHRRRHLCWLPRLRSRTGRCRFALRHRWSTGGTPRTSQCRRFRAVAPTRGAAPVLRRSARR